MVMVTRRANVGKTEKVEDNAWFVGYAPRRNPEIVVAVLVGKRAHGGTVSGPVVRDIIKPITTRRISDTEPAPSPRINTYRSAHSAALSPPVMASNRKNQPTPAHTSERDPNLQ